MKKQPELCRPRSQRALSAGWIYSAFQLVFLPGILTDFAVSWRISDALINFVYYGLNFAAYVLIFRDFLLESLARAGQRLGRFALAVTVGFFAHFFLSRAVSMALEYFDAGFANVNDRSVAAMIAQAPRLMPLALILMVPVAEECVFRGLIFAGLWPQNRPLAYGLSALAFCAVHVLGYAGQAEPLTLVLCAVQYLPAGLILAAAYRFCGSIAAPIFIHAAANAAAYVLL